MQRDDLADALTPIVRRMLEDELPREYLRARKLVAVSLRKHGEAAAADALPESCPYSFEQITGDWLP